MKRSDLRLPAFPDAEDMPFPAPVSDDDLRSMAPELLAVLLDGVDVEALGEARNQVEWYAVNNQHLDAGRGRIRLNTVLAFVDASLAAVAEGDTTDD